MASQADDSPFTSTSGNVHPQCVPAKAGSVSAVRLLKPPKPPERPLMPYMRYSRAVWESVKAEHKDCKLWEIGRIIGQLWRELPAQDKQKYIDEWESEKNDYAETLKAYQNSAAYQQYLVAKEKAAAGGSSAAPAEHTTSAKGVGTQAANRQKQWAETTRGGRNSMVSSTSAAQHQGNNETPRYPPTVPPVDAEVIPPNGTDLLESADIYNVRRLSAQRYSRNQRLLYEILNEAAVPDLRSIVTLPRMNMLKRQVHSLTMHQQKLESDLEQLNNKFMEKKRHIESTREDFHAKMRKLCQPAVEEGAYEKMVEKASEQLLRDYERYKSTQQKKTDADATKKSDEASRQDEKQESTSSSNNAGHSAIAAASSTRSELPKDLPPSATAEHKDAPESKAEETGPGKSVNIKVEPNSSGEPEPKKSKKDAKQ